MKKTFRAFAIVLCLMSLCCLLTGCLGNGVKTVYEDNEYGFQTALPKEGDTIAIIHTSKGDIYVRLFPEAAPKAVENFIKLASGGYYDGLIFHRVIDDFMIQGGDPNGDGTGGESIYTDNVNKTFEDEFDQKLLNLRGALAMANSGEDSNGSQFFINQTSASGFGRRESYTEENIDVMYQTAYQQYVTYYGDSFTKIYGNWQAFKDASHTETYIYDRVPEEVWALYEKNGGNISLDGAWRKSGGHTVFGHVFKGMGVVDTIAGVEVDENDKPVKDVVINSVEVTVYKASMAPATTTTTTTTTAGSTTTTTAAE